MVDVGSRFVSCLTRRETLSVSLNHRIIGAMWLLFVAYWAVAAVGAKRNASGRLWGGGIGLRLVVILLIATVLRLPSLREFLAETQRSASQSRNSESFIGISPNILCQNPQGTRARWQRLQ